eukprot:6181628-Pleurochrysis_carterae.AAC.1
MKRAGAVHSYKLRIFSRHLNLGLAHARMLDGISVCGIRMVVLRPTDCLVLQAPRARRPGPRLLPIDADARRAAGEAASPLLGPRTIDETVCVPFTVRLTVGASRYSCSAVRESCFLSRLTDGPRSLLSCIFVCLQLRRRSLRAHACARACACVCDFFCLQTCVRASVRAS